MKIIQSLFKFLAHLLSTSFFTKNYLFLKKGRNHGRFDIQRREFYSLSKFLINLLAFSQDYLFLKSILANLNFTIYYFLSYQKLFILKEREEWSTGIRYSTTTILSPFQIFTKPTSFFTRIISSSKNYPDKFEFHNLLLSSLSKIIYF